MFTAWKKQRKDDFWAHFNSGKQSKPVTMNSVPLFTLERTDSLEEHGQEFILEIRSVECSEAKQ